MDSSVGDLDASGHLISPFYGYLPLKWVSDMFFLLFLITTVLHFTQATYHRTWWLFPTVVLGGAGEAAGWAGRIWSHQQPLVQTPYQIQIISLIIAPTPLIGGLFITFGRLTARSGQQYSRLSPRLYSKIFFTVDIIALLIQAAGGGLAGGNGGVIDEIASYIMLGGILDVSNAMPSIAVSLTIFYALMVEYLVRGIKNRPLRRATESVGAWHTISGNTGAQQSIEKPMKYLAFALCAEATFLWIRGVYRTVELADGWDGKVIHTQSLFIAFDGVMVFLTMLIMNIFHPGRFLSTDGTTGLKDILLHPLRRPSHGKVLNTQV
ncbi:RTA1 like protein [Trametes maxima]|nr:RTA1 like protein [Trametes maxima]